MKSYDRLIAWLNDAYAMEQALTQVLERRVKDATSLPSLQQLDERHLAETRRHAALVAGCIEHLGGKTSGIKSALGTAVGTLQAPLTVLAADKLVKNCLADDAAEQFEVISYQAMADALVHHLPSVIAAHLPEASAATRAQLATPPSVTHEA